jgi:hypothetical protein
MFIHSLVGWLQGLDQVRELWLKSGMRWEDLLKPSGGNVQEFLKEHVRFYCYFTLADFSL